MKIPEKQILALLALAGLYYYTTRSAAAEILPEIPGGVKSSGLALGGDIDVSATIESIQERAVGKTAEDLIAGVIAAGEKQVGELLEMPAGQTPQIFSFEWDRDGEPRSTPTFTVDTTKLSASQTTNFGDKVHMVAAEFGIGFVDFVKGIVTSVAGPFAKEPAKALDVAKSEMEKSKKAAENRIAARAAEKAAAKAQRAERERFGLPTFESIREGGSGLGEQSGDTGSMGEASGGTPGAADQAGGSQSRY